mmetsp:Transcript_18381/g.42400  ORF Transcript_18381/g.42400 Transcript_18381/m.42400 type:complete len:1110 (-) Transcript_18381:268-3597(-)|eukprot:CAMPEP_0197192726 /NCGR_PEP_ID=MMETSP1423-20130617/25601_1 /TAXON_ID=476441 /ORGANISM="Pseudo-nitzschia heimii, Strain UNC1101" /LENGTH=1109 /DNA_ID=CAMNT_0042645675 /DNA_START=61 /DNA_END=3390 /DNA_ORIENTATION=+
MGKSKDKDAKKGKGSGVSAIPTFEFDLEFQEKPSDMLSGLDNDEKSISSSASKKMMKKVKNLLSRSVHKGKNENDPPLSTVSKKKKGFTPPSTLDYEDVDDVRDSSEGKGKKGLTSPPVNVDYLDAGPDDRSRGDKSKKKKKKGSKSALGESRHGGSIAANGGKKSKKKKKKPKNGDGDASVNSTRSSRSTRSKKSFKKGKPKSCDMLGMSLEVADQRRMNEMEIENAALLEETATIRRQLNEAEKVLRRAQSGQNPQQGNFDQIRELETAQNEARNLTMELEEYENAVIEKDELIQKLTEAVDAQLDKVEVLEVKLDRAEEEFCKMEEEMKDMEDVIEDLKSGSSRPVNLGFNDDDTLTESEKKSSDEEMFKKMEERERDFEKKEKELLEKEDYILERETLLKEQEEELKRKRSALLKPKQTFGQNLGINLNDNVHGLKEKINQLEAENDNLSGEIKHLREHDEEELKSLQCDFEKNMADSKLEIEKLRLEIDDLKEENNFADEKFKSLQVDFDKNASDFKSEKDILQRELDFLKQGKDSNSNQVESLRDSFDKRVVDSKKENEKLRLQLDILTEQKISNDKELKSSRDKFDKKMADSKRENEMLRQKLDGFTQQKNSDAKSLRDDFDKKITDSQLKNEILQRELDDFKKRKNSENEALRQQIEELRKQKTHVEASSRQMRRMESMRMLEPASTKNLDIDDEFGLEVEVEIAELREKIVEQEEYSMKLKQEIATHIDEKEEIKQEVQERELEMRELENQLSATKEASDKKVKQKDETITFMQNTMMQIMQEKQQLDKQLRGNNLDRTQIELMKRGDEDDEAEKAKIAAINSELRKLDDNNRLLKDELNKYKYDSSLKLKEKESIVLELQEELSDVKWELGAREKGADYITLLKDRKERKNQINKVRKELKEAEEKILELELQKSDLSSDKKGLEKEIESLTKSALSEEIGEQISGLKRQIKSLKQHNAALERKLDTESREFKDGLGEKEAKIRILEFELDKLRKPAQHVAQNAIRGVAAGFLGFGKRNGENSNDNAHHTEVNNESNINNDETKLTRSEHADRTAKDNGKPGNIWGLFRKQNGADAGTIDNEKDSAMNSSNGFESTETL